MFRRSTLMLIFCVHFFAQASQPKLVIFISIDQMRADYFERFDTLFSGGLKKLYNQGIVYKEANLNYASSETGPGHATLSTGTYPHKSGILANDWIDPTTRKSVYCVSDENAKSVEGEGGGFSAKNLAVTTIGDWLKKTSPNSKVVSISAKDRAAILMGGKNPDKVFWYQKKNGKMVTSNYYMQQLPEWAKKFNDEDWIEKNLPKQWEKSLPEKNYITIQPDEFFAETPWEGNTVFPHPFTEKKKTELILRSPYGDNLVLDFVKEAIIAEQLGKRDVSDLLCISLSDCDYIGHNHGPNSHEMVDHLVHLDKALGQFFDFVEKNIGKENFLVVLSADHAVFPLPEYLVQYTKISDARRILYNEEFVPQVGKINSALQKELNTQEVVLDEKGFLNYKIAKKMNVDSIQLEKEVYDGLLKIDCVAEVYFKRELASSQPFQKLYMKQFRNSYYVERGEDFQIRFKENYLVTPYKTGASHGTVYKYDTHVPIIFWWNDVQPQIIAKEVHTVDIAPTLAKILNVRYPNNLDGVVLEEIKK